MYSVSTTIKMLSTAALIASFSIAAQTPHQSEEVDTTAAKITEQQDSVVKTPKVNSIEANTQTCPEQFYQVKLPNNGKLCQVFAADLPASMIFFVPQLPEEVIAFYKQDTATFSTSRQVKDRVLLQSQDKNTTLIISSDGQGTQVDILVKNSNS